MAIRMELPTAVYVRLRWAGVQARWKQRSGAVKSYFTRTASAPLEWRQRRAALAANRFLEQVTIPRRALLDEFETRYEDLIDLLCWAAKEGVQPAHIARYGALRSWMMTHYPEIQSCLKPHWGDSSVSQPDPFEALFLPISVQEVTNSATGIDAMMLTRGALEACREAVGGHTR